MNERFPQGWEWSMRITALSTIVAIICAYFLPSGNFRLAAFLALAPLIIFFFYARSKARPNEEFKDTPWNI
jgi:hypothetical protein